MDLSQFIISDNMASMANMYAKQNALDIMRKNSKKKGFLGNVIAQDYFAAPAGASMSAMFQQQNAG